MKNNLIMIVILLTLLLLVGAAGYTLMGKEMRRATGDVAVKQPECDKAIDSFISAHRTDGRKEKAAMCSILKIEHPNTRMVYLKGCKEQMEIKCD